MRRRFRILRRRESSGPIGCLEAQKMIEPYLGDTLSDEELYRFIEHIDHCPECSEELEIFHLVYQTLGAGEDETKGDIVPLEETLRRSRARLARLNRIKKARRGVATAAFIVVFVFVCGLFFPTMPLSPHNTGVRLRRLMRPGQRITEAETETEIPDLETVLGELTEESEISSEAEALLLELETEENFAEPVPVKHRYRH